MASKKLHIIFAFLLLFPSIIFAEGYKYSIFDNEVNIDVTKEKIYYTENTIISFSESNVSVEKKLNDKVFDLEMNTNYVKDNKNNSIIINSNNKSNYNYVTKYNINKNSDYKYTIKVSNEYQVPMENVSFTLDVYKKISKNNISVYYKDKNITKDTIIKVEDNQVIGEFEGRLDPGETIYIKIDYTKLYISPLAIFSILFPIVCCLLSYIMWYLYGKDLKTKVVKTAVLPRTINPIDAALIYNEKITKDDVFNLLLYLATKGYIKIEENDKHEYTLTRTNTYKGKDYRESLFIKKLFKKEKTISLSDYINAVSERRDNLKYELIDVIPYEELNKRFNNASNSIINLSYTDSEKAKYFEDSAESLKKTLILMAALILVTITSIPFIEINKLYLLPLSVCFSIVILKVLLDSVSELNLRALRKVDVIAILVIIIIIALILMTPSFATSKLYVLTFLISSISVTIILFLYKYMPKRTVYGSRLLGKIDGLKEFILTCKDEELERVLELEPNYLFELLPYARVLGVEKNVISKMRKYNPKSPEWFEMKDYTAVKLYNSLKRLNEELNREGDLE